MIDALLLLAAGAGTLLALWASNNDPAATLFAVAATTLTGCAWVLA